MVFLVNELTAECGLTITGETWGLGASGIVFRTCIIMDETAVDANSVANIVIAMICEITQV